MIEKLIQKETLEILDVTENEFKLYLALIHLGKSTVQKIAKEMGIFRSSAYVLIESLARKGLISQEYLKRGRYVIAEPPKVLSRLIRDKQKQFDKTKTEIEEKIPDLTNLYDHSLKDPVIKVYDGVNGLIALHDDIIETGKTLYCYPRMDVALNVLPIDFQVSFVQRRIEKNIKAMAIVLESDALKFTINKVRDELQGKDPLREARVLPDPLKDIITAEKMFYGNKVVYMTYDKKITGILIEHEEIARLEKKHFNILWRMSTPYNQ